MIELLIFIKHRFAFIWEFAESINDAVFSLLYTRKLSGVVSQVFSEISQGPFLIEFSIWQIH